MTVTQMLDVLLISSENWSFKTYTPGKLTWKPKMKVWKMIFFFSWVIFRFHVIKMFFCFRIQMLIRLVVVFNGQNGM